MLEVTLIVLVLLWLLTPVWGPNASLAWVRRKVGARIMKYGLEREHWKIVLFGLRVRGGF